MSEPTGFMAEKPKQNSFKLHYISGILAGILIVSHIILALRANDSSELGEVLAGMVAMLVVSLFLAWLAFLVIGRSSLIGNLVFCWLIIASILVPLRKGLSTRANVVAQSSDLETKRIAVEALKQLESGHAITPNFSGDKQNIAELEEKSKTLEGAFKSAVDCMAAVLRDREVPLQEYQSAYQDLGAAGGMDPTSLTSRSEIEERIAIVGRLEKANDSYTDRVTQSLKVFEDCMNDSGVTGNELKTAVEAYGKSAGIREILAVRETDRRLFKAMHGLLKLHDKHWGGWRVDPATKRVIFDADSARNEANSLVKELHAAGRDQQAIQKETLGRIANDKFP